MRAATLDEPRIDASGFLGRTVARRVLLEPPGSNPPCQSRRQPGNRLFEEVLRLFWISGWSRPQPAVQDARASSPRELTESIDSPLLILWTGRVRRSAGDATPDPIAWPLATTPTAAPAPRKCPLRDARRGSLRGPCSKEPCPCAASRSSSPCWSPPASTPERRPQLTSSPRPRRPTPSSPRSTRMSGGSGWRATAPPGSTRTFSPRTPTRSRRRARRPRRSTWDGPFRPRAASRV